MNKELHNRKTPIHLPARENIGYPVIVFVTVCTDKRKPILCRPEIRYLLVEAWQKADSWLVGKYVLMPDHIHLFCSPTESDIHSLTKWVQYWKSLVSRKWPRHEDHPVWQKSYWDTQLRREESYKEKWDYVCENPVRKGLVADPDDWPFQGELNVLE